MKLDFRVHGRIRIKFTKSVDVIREKHLIYNVMHFNGKSEIRLCTVKKYSPFIDRTVNITLR